MRNPKAFLACLLLLQAAAAEAQVYRCEQNGKLSFSDQPCKPGAKSSQKNYAPPPAPDAKAAQKDSAPAPAASGTPDVKIEVSHYQVQGKDYSSLSQRLNAGGPQGFHGLASWKIRYDYTTKAQGEGCKIDMVQVSVTGEIVLPRWTDEKSAPPELQQRWSAYYAALKKHEDGHIRHARELALQVKNGLMGLGVVPCDQLQGLAEREYERLSGIVKARDLDYDARTRHGTLEGAKF